MPSFYDQNLFNFVDGLGNPDFWDQVPLEGYPDARETFSKGIDLDPTPWVDKTGQLVIQGDISNQADPDSSNPENPTATETEFEPPQMGEEPKNNDDYKIINSRFTSVSWIHKNSLSGKFLHDPPPSEKIDFEFINKGEFRFANYLSAWIQTPDQKTIVAANFADKSGVYTRKSFAGTSSQVAKPFYEIAFVKRLDGVEGARFGQRVYARTLTVKQIIEVIGLSAPSTVQPFVDVNENIEKAVKDVIGEHVVNFPPIFTSTNLTIYADGTAKWGINRISYFPCHNFYFQHPKNNPADTRQDRVLQILSGTHAEKNWHEKGEREAGRLIWIKN